MKRLTFILTLCLVGVVLAAGIQGAPRTSSAAVPAVPAVSLKEEVEYYPGGQVHERHTYYLTPLGRRVKHGLSKAYRKNGHLFYQEEYRHGLMDGEIFRFHFDGALASHTRWVRGKRTGLAQGWYQGGELRWQATYRDGKIVGEKLWIDDGAVVCKETYGADGKLAKKVGLYPWVRGKERIKRYEGNYRSGVMHGAWTFWYSDGSIKSVGEWKDGKPWSGICATPAAGDAGSWGGILVFNEYKDGKNLGRAKLPPEPKARPKAK